jgi:ABC-type phosphate/phosphonate transport system substrate-binding protein
VDPFNVLGLSKKPLRVGVTKLELSPLMWPKRHLFELAMCEYLGQPVQFELMTPRQIRVHMGTGRLQFAMLKPQEYPEVAEAETCEILAVPVNQQGQTYRQGLVVASADSAIQALPDVRSRRFHFLNLGNPLNDAALKTLLDAGVCERDIDRGILGLRIDTYHISAFEAAKSVVYEKDSAGVIDKHAYLSWPEKGGNFLLLSPSRDKLRVLAETVRIPEGPFVASVRTKPKLVDRVRTFLLEVAPDKYKVALAAMGWRGFSAPVDPQAYEAFAAAYQELHPDARATATTPATVPAE